MLEITAGPVAPAVTAPARWRLQPTRLLAWLFFGLALLFAVVAAINGDVFFFRLATEALIFGGLALSVDLLLGRTGLLPLGQALFFGFGAYVSALVLKVGYPSFWLAMAVVLAATTLAGLLAGVIAIRTNQFWFGAGGVQGGVQHARAGGLGRHHRRTRAPSVIRIF